MPPPVTETTLLRCSVGSITSGPPQPVLPREMRTALYVLAMMSSPPLQLDALAAGHDGGDALGQHALEQDDDEADDGGPDRHLDVVTGNDGALLFQLQQRHENAAPDEIFAGVDVREQAKRRVHIGNGRVIEG